MIPIHGKFSSVVDAGQPLSRRVGAEAAGLAGQGLGAERLCFLRQDVSVSTGSASRYRFHTDGFFSLRTAPPPHLPPHLMLTPSGDKAASRRATSYMHCRLLLISLAKRGATPLPLGRLVPPGRLPEGALFIQPILAAERTRCWTVTS